MLIEHEVRATIRAPIDDVWRVLGSFGDTSWYPGITAGKLIGEKTPSVGSVREMRMPDGTTIRERLEALGPGRSFAYSFDGTPPFPVDASRTTVTAAPAAALPDSATIVTWHGRFDVADQAIARTVEHVNREIVWPALIDALAAKLRTDHTIESPTPTPDQQAEAIGRGAHTHQGS